MLKNYARNRNIGAALAIIGAACFGAFFFEKYTFGSYCTGSSYCQNLYSIPELEIGIFGAVLISAGLVVFSVSIFSSTKSRRELSSKG